MVLDQREKTDPLNLVETKLGKFNNLPNQICLIDFFSQIINREEYSNLLTKIRTSKNLYLNISKIHGQTHADNVSLFATYIALCEGISQSDISLLQEAAIYHDIGRISDYDDNNHGELGAIKYLKMVSPNNEVAFLIESHATKLELNDLANKYKILTSRRRTLFSLVNIIRDADALDRTRFRLTKPSNNLDISYLKTNSSQKIIRAALELNYIIYANYIKSLNNQSGKQR